jgi:hypothetical protein
MNEELRSIYVADQADRAEGILEMSVIDRDLARRLRVRELLSSEAVRTAADFFHAAMVFQHGPEEEDSRIANDLARKALELGHVGEAWWCSAAWLVAASGDRLLMRQGRAQKYGTQFLRRGLGGPLELWEVDPDTTDEERAALNVPPIAEALARAEGRICPARN